MPPLTATRPKFKLSHNRNAKLQICLQIIHCQSAAKHGLNSTAKASNHNILLIYSSLNQQLYAAGAYFLLQLL